MHYFEDVTKSPKIAGSSHVEYVNENPIEMGKNSVLTF